MLTPEEAAEQGYAGAVQVVVYEAEGLTATWVYGLRPERHGLTYEAIEEAALARVDRLTEHGPDLDGWSLYPRADGTPMYQLLLRAVELPTPV